MLPLANCRGSTGCADAGIRPFNTAPTGPLSLATYSVEQGSFCAVYVTRHPRLDEVRRIYGDLAVRYRVALTSANPDIAAYLAVIAEQVWDIDERGSDQARHAIQRSGVVPLLGAKSIVQHLDSAVSTLLGDCFSYYGMATPSVSD